ncbi:hypothetical protein [Nonomuraea sp. NPDC049750]|uniref:hypothetical protein n=1 Tax=Nonomuraea sp. NPDC049750 TaxID=3154738 RepID=UPI0033E92AAA
MKASTHRLLGVVLVILSVSSCAAIGRSAPVPDGVKVENVSIDAILIGESEIPASLTERLQLRNRLADVRKESLVEFMGAKNYRIRSWNREGAGRSASLSQVVYEFPNPDQARSYFVERPYGENFHLVDGLKATIVEDLRGVQADDSNVFCVSSAQLRIPINTCGQWGARLRYKSFVVDLIVRRYVGGGDYASVPVGSFFDYVRLVDDYIAKKIGK